MENYNPLSLKGIFNIREAFEVISKIDSWGVLFHSN